MKYSVALTSETNSVLINHLIRKDNTEDLCFALWYPSTGQGRASAIIKEIILPQDHDRNLHGNVSLNACYLESVIDTALKQNAGIALLHSHPYPGWQNVSKEDVSTERSLAKTAFAVTGLPFIGLTISNDETWSARFWIKRKNKFEMQWCENVRVVGDGINVSFNDTLIPPPGFSEELLRTISSWGPECQAQLARLHIGIVGIGSVGSIIAENLARCGIQKITLIDFDRIERKNRDRILYADKSSIGKLKVKVIARGLRKCATAKNFEVIECPYSIVEEKGFLSALDCDILFSCVDRPWARYVLNGIAYSHLIPVIDGGISVRVKTSGKIRGADWKAHIVTPGRKCLECLKQYDAELVSLEMTGLLDDPSYIQGLPKEHLINSNQNVFSFSLNLASLEMQQLLSFVIQPSGIADVGNVLYHFVPGTLHNERSSGCLPTCSKVNEIALGDLVNNKFIAGHKRAHDSRMGSQKIVERFQVLKSKWSI